MLDNCVVNQTYLIVLPIETCNLCLCFKNHNLKINVPHSLMNGKSFRDVYIKCTRFIYIYIEL